MRYLSLFSGIEAASSAWMPLGFEPIAFAEIEPFPSAVLAQHYPNVPNLGDVTKITQQTIESLGHIDIVIGGFPCQDLSVAGKRKGLKHADGTVTRSGLFYTAVDIADWTRARWVVLENVPGLFSSNGGRDFASVVGELAGAEVSVPRDGWRNTGVALGPKGLVEWFVLDAQWRGLAQRRKRVFIVRDSGDWANRPPLFFDAASLLRDSPPSRKTGQRVAPTVESRTNGGGGGWGTDFTTGGGGLAEVSMPLDGLTAATRSNAASLCQYVDRIAPPIMSGANTKAAHNARSGMSKDSCLVAFKPSHFTRGKDGAPDVVTPPLSADADKGDQDTVIMAHGQAGAEIVRDGSPSLTCNHEAPIAFQPRIARNGRGDMGEKVNALNAQSCETGKGDAAPCVAFQPRYFTRDNKTGNAESCGEQVPALSADHGGGDSAPHVASGYAVRRLTPTECCRLQGFSDSYLDIEFRGKPACDGVKYRALGNSMAVPVIRYIGERIVLATQQAPMTPLSPAAFAGRAQQGYPYYGSVSNGTLLPAVWLASGDFLFLPISKPVNPVVTTITKHHVRRRLRVWRRAGLRNLGR